jgi:glc operon protein GlcG
MRHLPLVGVAVYVALVFGTTVHAQQPAPPPAPLPEYGPTVTLEQAMKVANAALAEAKKLNVVEAITIVDNGGRLVYFLKMDDLRQIGVDLSRGKARTSAFTKLPSKAYEDRVASGGVGVAALSYGITAAAGGLPLIMNGKMIGAIGVGGGPNGVIDAQVAQAGLDALK